MIQAPLLLTQARLARLEAAVETALSFIRDPRGQCSVCGSFDAHRDGQWCHVLSRALAFADGLDQNDPRAGDPALTDVAIATRRPS